MTHIRIFLGLIFRRDGYGGWFDPIYAWQMSGILAQHEADWRRIE